MTDVSEGGAAFVLEGGNVPQIGDYVTLSDMHQHSEVFRQIPLFLPKTGKVLRVGHSDNAAVRVAIQFDASEREIGVAGS